jgi:hypothetical protein
MVTKYLDMVIKIAVLAAYRVLVCYLRGIDIVYDPSPPFRAGFLCWGLGC